MTTTCFNIKTTNFVRNNGFLVRLWYYLIDITYVLVFTGCSFFVFWNFRSGVSSNKNPSRWTDIIDMEIECIIEKEIEKNRNSRLLGHVNFDGQKYRFVKKSDKYGFFSGFGH